MNATDLILKMLATDQLASMTSAPASIRPADQSNQASQSVFRATFQKALNSDQNRNTSAFGINKADNNKPPIDNANFTQKQQSADNSTDSTALNGTTVRSRNAYRTLTRPAAKADQQPSQDTPTQTAAAADTQKSAQSTQQQSSANDTSAASATAAATPADSAQQASDTAAKVQAIVDKIEQQLRDVESGKADDKQLQQLLLDLLALLLSGQNKGQDVKQAAQNSGSGDATSIDGLKLTFLLDKDSDLYKQLSQLLAKVDSLSPELRDQIKLLVKLSDDKAMQISIADLIGKAQAQDGTDEQQQQTLALTIGDGSKGQDGTASITLTLTPEAVGNAQIVDLPKEMSDTQAAVVNGQAQQTADAKNANLALLVPANLITEDQLKAMDTEVAQQQQIGQQQEVQQQADASGIKAQLLIIPTAGQGKDSLPAVLTTDINFLKSDEFLKRLDVQALANQLTDSKKVNSEVAARIEKLLSPAKSADSFSVLPLDGKDGSFEFFKDFYSRDNGQKEQQQSQSQPQQQPWQSDLLKDQLREQMSPERLTFAARIGNDAAADRIPFLGRPTGSVQNLFQQSMQQVADTRAPQSNSEVYQNVMEQITGRIQFASMSAAGGEVRIFLRPENLGDVQLKVRVDNDVVVAKFVAHSQEVKAIIESNLGQLRDSLAEAGIKAGKIVVTLGNEQQQQQNPQQPASDGGGQQPGGPAYVDSATVTSLAAEAAAVLGQNLPVMDDVIYSTKPLVPSTSRVSYLA